MKSVGRTLALLSLIFLSFYLLAQTPDTGVIKGRVLDPSGAAVSGAEISVANQDAGLDRKVQTDSSGNFQFAGLPILPGYDLTATHSGFAEADVPNVALIGGRTAEVTIRLQLAGEKTEVTVTGTAGTIQTSDSQVGVRLSARQMEETPLLNRRITYLPLLNAANRPALNQGDFFMNQNLFTTNGTGRRQAYFEVDGSNAVDSWGRQTIFTNLPLDSLQEMTVLDNSFSAEYGWTAGSVVNIVTKRGGNGYHGEILALGRPGDTSASLSGFTPQNATSGADITEDTLAQIAAAFSGPIGSSDKTHFFLNSEYSWQNRTSPITSSIAPGSFEGHYRDWMASLRLDHQLNENNNLFFRSSLDQFHDTNPNGTVGGNTLPSVDRVFKRRTYTEQLGETAVLSPNLMNDIRLQFQLASPITEFDPVIFGTQFIVPIAGGATFTSGTSQAAVLQNRQYEVTDTLFTTHGRHTLRFGGDVIRSHSGGNGKEFGGPFFLGQFKYNTCEDPLAVCESPAFLNDIANVQSYTQSFGNASYIVDDTLWALFVQDDIRVRPDLTVNLGLRYERQTFADSTKNFAPRVGFSYNLHGNGKAVLRGGFGIYYSQIVDNSEANYALTGPTGIFNFTASPGEVGFPTSVAAAPLPAFPAGAAVPLRSLYIRPGDASFYDQFFPTSTLIGYQSGLLNPYTEQWTLGLEQELAKDWVLSIDYVGSHSLKINRPLDVDPPSPFIRTKQGQSRDPGVANCTRPLWVNFHNQLGVACDPDDPTLPTPPYALIQSDVNDGFAFYNALDVNLSHRFTRRLSMLASYTWSHAIDNVDPDVPQQNPNDPNFTGTQEIGNAIFDQRHRFVLSGFYIAPLKINIGGVATLASGLPFNIVTGSTNSGDTGGTTDRPVINGAVIPRNAGRGRAIYDVSPFIERPFALGSERVQLTLRAEAFNVTNHPNFVGYSGTFGNKSVAPSGLGLPLFGITNQLPARSLQFSGKLTF